MMLLFKGLIIQYQPQHKQNIIQPNSTCFMITKNKPHPQQPPKKKLPPGPSYIPYIPKSPPKAHKSPSPSLSPSSQSRIKTAGPQQIRQLAEKHYNQAMKYVYKKNNQQEELVRREKERDRPEREMLTEEHTFRPFIRHNKYNKKIEEQKDRSKQKQKQIKDSTGSKVLGKVKLPQSSHSKQVQLYKWGINHQALRRDNVIAGQVKVIRSSLQKQYRSLQNSRNSSLENSIIEKRTKTSTDNLTKSNESKADKIPGVRKYYLNQAKAQISKTSNQRLLFRGNEVTGFYF